VHALSAATGCLARAGAAQLSGLASERRLEAAPAGAFGVVAGSGLEALMERRSAQMVLCCLGRLVGERSRPEFGSLAFCGRGERGLSLLAWSRLFNAGAALEIVCCWT
jgi:hypothetical protein